MECAKAQVIAGRIFWFRAPCKRHQLEPSVRKGCRGHAWSSEGHLRPMHTGPSLEGFRHANAQKDNP
eukprot:4594297-Pyramimonas_sp.AAC.1